MKRIIALLLVLLLGATATAETAVPSTVPTEMTVTSSGIVDGILADTYGKKGEQLNKGIPTRSMPLTIAAPPEGSACLAIEIVDPDGGNWVHWLAANLPVCEEIPENASIDWADQMVQGKNSFQKLGYGGPTPPSGTHTYIITVYALSAPVELKEGFTQKAFHKAIDNVTLTSASVTGDYSK